ncbi:MAG: hypothetical protein JWN77_355, partial [Frankiales bacterium]|nr:hypothetical protein [Frankiales bacterium]
MSRPPQHPAQGFALLRAAVADAR